MVWRIENINTLFYMKSIIQFKLERLIKYDYILKINISK